MEIKNYDVMLLKLIRNLKNLPHKEGAEGVAYFFMDKVIKEYYPTDDVEAVFELYCKEQQNLVEAGYNLPKIYSYLKIDEPSKNGKGKSKTRFFVLEERF